MRQSKSCCVLDESKLILKQDDGMYYLAGNPLEMNELVRFVKAYDKWVKRDSAHVYTVMSKDEDELIVFLVSYDIARSFYVMAQVLLNMKDEEYEITKN